MSLGKRPVGLPKDDCVAKHYLVEVLARRAAKAGAPSISGHMAVVLGRDHRRRGTSCGGWSAAAHAPPCCHVGMQLGSCTRPCASAPRRSPNLRLLSSRIAYNESFRTHIGNETGSRVASVRVWPSTRSKPGRPRQLSRAYDMLYRSCASDLSSRSRKLFNNKTRAKRLCGGAASGFHARSAYLCVFIG
jgi:hypothetical protein